MPWRTTKNFLVPKDFMAHDNVREDSHDDEVDEKLEQLADLLFDMWVLEVNESYNKQNG